MLLLLLLLRSLLLLLVLLLYDSRAGVPHPIHGDAFPDIGEKPSVYIYIHIYGNFLLYIEAHQYTRLNAQILGYPNLWACIPIDGAGHAGNSEMTMLDTSMLGKCSQLFDPQGNHDASQAAEMLAQGIQTTTWDHGRDTTTHGRLVVFFLLYVMP